jgi:M6 family metalloprotease-like protein
MRPSIGWPIAIVFLLLAGGAWAAGDAIEEWIIDNQIISESDEGTLVGMHTQERWLVVLIDFPDQDEMQGCDQQRAETMFSQSAINHIDQTSGGQVELTVDYHDEIITPSQAMSTYGKDVDGERDAGADGHNPHTLAEEVVKDISEDVEWGNYDMDGDGWVDRFLILHCIKPQEDGGGSSNRIWSHFSSIENVVDLGSGLSIAHYTIGSQKTSNNFGTLIHEMYHQLGALDLYPVHDETVAQSWKGVGKWDVMASGNWNGNGAWPALPTSATMEVIGTSRHTEMELEWPTGESCTGATVPLTGMSDGGTALKIDIGEGEFVWVESRTDSGFDSNLPGHGVLVLKQDTTAGSVLTNTVNSHPEQPWLVVIEADGRQDLVKGVGEGESSDLFQDGDTFGATGILIRDHDGVLVDWSGEVTKSEDNYSVQFSSEGCGHATEVNLPNHGSVLTVNDSIPFSANCVGMELNLVSSDDRLLSYQEGFLVFDSPGMKGVVGTITGTIDCASGSIIDVKHDFEILGSIPVNSYFESNILIDEISIITIPLEFVGDEEQMWLVGLEGPLERIATTGNRQSLGPGDSIILEINPDGLLTPGMLAKGEVVIASDSGHQWVVEVELTADSEESSGMAFMRDPGILVPLALSLCALWVIMGIRSSSRKVAPELEEVPVPIIHDTDPTLVDPFR